MNRLLFVLVSLFGIIVSSCQCKDDPLVVNTNCGAIRGTVQEGTMAFLGIPYARVERFLPPQLVEPWDTVRPCDHFGPQAMQQTGGHELSESEMSEKNSCVLNVWTTDKRRSSSRDGVAAWRRFRLWLFGLGSRSKLGQKGRGSRRREPSSQHPRLPRPLGCFIAIQILWQRRNARHHSSPAVGA